MHTIRCTKMKCGPNQGQSIPRNYSCSLCEYKSNQSRLFLVHQVQAHKANYSIYPCEYCGYATRYRNKLVRHHANIHSEYGELVENDVLPLAAPIEMEKIEADLIAKGFWVEIDESLQKQATSSAQVPKSTVMIKSPTPVTKRASYSGSKSNTAQYIYEGKSEETGMIEFRCKLCTYKSPHRWSAMKHVRNMHINGKLYCCDKCNFSTEKKIEFSIHKAKHANQRMFNCSECEYETNQKSNLDRHQSNHTGLGPIKCELCSYSSTGSPAILRHMQEHHRGANVPDSLMADAEVKENEESEDSQEMIDYEDYRKMTEMEINENMEDESSEDNLSIESLPPEEDSIMEGLEDQTEEKSKHNSMECPLCHLQLPNESQLRSHIIVHPKFQPWICPECKSRYRRSSDLSRHLKKKHARHISEYPRQALIVITLNSPPSGTDHIQVVQSGSEGKVGPNGEQPLDLSHRDEEELADVKQVLFQQDLHKCKYCSYRAKFPADLRRHMSQSHRNQIQAVGRFACTHCERSYKYRSDLYVHMRKTHRIDTSKLQPIMAVPSSPKKFTHFGVPKSEQQMETAPLTPRSPRMKHTPMRPPPDKKPTKQTKVTDSLDKSKNHRCLYCDYVGSCKSEIDRHTLTHTGQKPFQCLYCDYKTIWKGDMKRHLQKHHTEEVNKGELMSLLEKTYKPAEMPERNSVETTYESFLEKSSFDCDNDSSMMDQEEFEPPKEVTQPYTMEQLYGPAVFEAGIYEAGTVVVIPEAPEDTNLSQNSFDAELKKYPELVDNPEYIDMEHDDFKKAISPLKDTERASPDPSRSSSSTPKNDSTVSQNSFLMETDEDGKRTVFCPKCPFTCDAPSKMKNHVLIHENVKKFKCAYCGKRSNWLWDVRKHIKATHPGEDPKNVITMSVEEARATLDEYLKNFRPKSSRASLPQSSPSVLTDSPSQVIPRSLYYSAGKKHVDRDITREESPKIEDPMGFPMNYKKIPAELRVKPFKCGVCGKRSNWKHDLIKHIRSHHKGKGEVVTLTVKEARDTLDEADVSPEKSSTKNSPVSENHSASQNQISGSVKQSPGGPTRCGGIKRYKCSDCPYRSDYSGDVTRHVPRRHPNNPKAALVVLSVEEAAETIDEYEYDWIKNRSKPAARTGEFNPGQDPKPVKKFKCSKCEFRAEDKVAVIQHLRSEHASSSKAAVYKCKLCNYQSIHVESVKKHLRETHKSVDYALIVKQMTEDLGGLNVKPTRSPLFKIRMDSRGGRFKCGVCGFLSPWKHSAERHIKKQHGDTSVNASLIILESKQNLAKKKRIYGNASSNKLKGLLNCHICPYQTRKKHLYQLHLNRHKKTPGNEHGCKYCTFYTCNSRLLNQHVQLHLNKPRETSESNASHSAQNKKLGRHRSYYCDKCPYIGKNLSDYLYHKQFHRPRANAPYKCEQCPYWASVKRLLSQHKKVHDPYYQDRLKSVGSRYPAGENITLLNPSPAKTDVSEDSYCVYDPVQMANLKQSIIMSKVKGVPIPRSSLMPHQVPMTPGTAMRSNEDPSLMYGAVVSKTGVIMNSSMYRKLHKCKYCPYTNAKGNNVKLHEKMHGPRKSGKEAFKCTYCNYHVGNKGLLKHHIKVHSKQYNPYRDEIHDTEQLSDESNTEDGDGSSDNNKSVTPQTTPVKLDPARIPSDTGFYIKFDEKTGEHRLESIRMKKWCCEKCPYATAKQAQFERHVKLHNSKQKYTCEYCDYSVPRYNLLLQHKTIHLYPNHNLLVTQSVSNLMKLPEVDADIAAAANFPVEKVEEQANSVHDHLELYENTENFMEPKKLYRCDRCPYANVQRSHLLSHLRCHMIKNCLQCPHCDYSVPKQHLLMQHIKIHFTGMDSDNATKSDDSDSEEELAIPLENSINSVDKMDLPTQDDVKKAEEGKTIENDKSVDEEPMDTEDVTDNPEKETDKHVGPSVKVSENDNDVKELEENGKNGDKKDAEMEDQAITKGKLKRLKSQRVVLFNSLKTNDLIAVENNFSVIEI